MKTNFVRAALTCAAFMITATTAIAAINPIPGVDIIVKKDPNNNALITATSDADGRITLKGLTPGNYEIIIDGPSLIAAMDRLAPPAPEKKTSNSSFSLGFGGFSGGGGSEHASSQQGAGPVGGGPTQTSRGGSRSSGGGVAIGAYSDGSVTSQESYAAPMVTFTATVTPSTQTGVTFLSETPYCRDTAGQGARIGFTVPEGGSGPEEVIVQVGATQVSIKTD